MGGVKKQNLLLPSHLGGTYSETTFCMPSECSPAAFAMKSATCIEPVSMGFSGTTKTALTPTLRKLWLITPPISTSQQMTQSVFPNKSSNVVLRMPPGEDNSFHC